MTRKQLACSVAAAALSLGVAHAATTTTLNIGGSSLAAPTYISEFKGVTSQYPTYLFNYEAVGSGGGQKAFLNNDITYFEPVSPTNPNGYAAGTLTYGTIVGTQVDIGASDATLSASQLTNPATGSYAGTNGSSAVDGPIIQIPTFGTPITMAFNESGVSGNNLTLTDSQICGVLSGKITDWNTLVPTIAPGTTIHVFVRSDGSGTTFLTTQHLAAVCNAGNSSFPSYPVPVTKYFYNSGTSATGYIFNTLPPNFTGESGSSNIASNELATADSFGYLSPDFTSIAPASASKTTLQVASVVNALNGKAYLPTVANTETGLAHAGPGSTNANPPNTLTNAMNPLNWVPTIPQTTSGYSIVGYTTMDLSSCYANKTAGGLVSGFLSAQYTNTSLQTIIKNNGFAPLVNTAAAPYVTTVNDVFFGNSSGFNLNVDNAKTCASYAGR